MATRRPVASLKQQQIARQWVAYNAREYQKTKYALYVWAAIQECVAAGLPLPTWTRAYLFEVSTTLGRLWRSGGKVPGADAIDKSVADALGVKGRGGFNPFRELQRPGHEILIAFQVYECQTKNRHYSWEAVWKDVADFHHRDCDICTKRMSWQKVRQYWYAHARAVIPPHLIDQSKSKKLADILR